MIKLWKYYNFVDSTLFSKIYPVLFALSPILCIINLVVSYELVLADVPTYVVYLSHLPNAFFISSMFHLPKELKRARVWHKDQVERAKYRATMIKEIDATAEEREEYTKIGEAERRKLLKKQRNMVPRPKVTVRGNK